MPLLSPHCEFPRELYMEADLVDMPPWIAEFILTQSI